MIYYNVNLPHCHSLLVSLEYDFSFLSMDHMTSLPPNIRTQLQSFIIIGILATLVDFGLYMWWHHYLPFSVAKTFSFIIGSGVAYLLNKCFTFKQDRHSLKSIKRFVILYGSSMGLNVFTNSLLIHSIRFFAPTLWITKANFILIIAFVMATGMSTIVNFMGQKFWVFKKENLS